MRRTALGVSVAPVQRRSPSDPFLDVLRHNVGFGANPHAWLPIAQRDRFQRVDARPLAACPDCNAGLGEVLGQFVQYSTLMRLRACACGLIYSDVRLAPEVVFRHFQETYKNEDYFRRERRAIYAHLAEVIDAQTPRQGVVLDVGGAKGHLMAAVRARRPDLGLLVNDLSPDACDHAEVAHGLPTYCGDAAGIRGRFSTVVVSDALYYAPDLRATLAALQRLVMPGGTLILRLPNKHWLIRAGLLQRPALQTRIRGFNPEHLYLFTRSYLRRRLAQEGFNRVRIAGSPAVGADPFARLVSAVARPLALTPSVVILAEKR